MQKSSGSQLPLAGSLIDAKVVQRCPTLRRVAGSQRSGVAPATTITDTTLVRAAATHADRASVGNKRLQTYTRRSEDGCLVYSEVQMLAGKRIVTVGIGKDDVPEGSTPELNWGFYRSSRNVWYHPDGCAPAGSTLNKTTGVVRSPMHKSTRGSQYEAKVQVPVDLEPVMLGCFVALTGEDKQDIGMTKDNHLCIPLGMEAGHAKPLGASITSCARGPQGRDLFTINFAVVSRNAASLALFLVRNSGPDNVGQGHLEIALDPVINRTGDVWHIAIKGLRDIENMCYGWRAGGVLGREDEEEFDSNTVLLDPYARMIACMTLPESAGPFSGNFPTEGDSNFALLGSMSHLVEPIFSWETIQQPRLAVEDSVVCTLDLKSISSPQGALVLALEKLRAAQDMGANTIHLRGVHLTDASDGPGGYSPVYHFGPDPSLASNGQPQQAALELKQFIKTCHQKGIEVLIEVDFCYSPETRAANPLKVSFGGLDKRLYYCNGALNCSHPVARQYVLDVLRNWVESFQVDGFVVKNAETMAKGRDGIVLDNPPLPESIAHDPILRRCKLVAMSVHDGELPQCGERGFPHWGTWLEWNKRFQQDVWEYMVDGKDGKLSAIATRITGSGDLFAARLDAGLPGCLAVGRRPAFGFNCAAHFAQSLTDAFSGDLQSLAPPVRALLATSLLFQGVPVLPCECLDYPVLHSLVRSLFRVRTAYKDHLLPTVLTSDKNLQWHGVDPENEPQWEGGGLGCNYIGYSLQSDATSKMGIYVGMNPHEYELSVKLPSAGDSQVWRCLLDTMDDSLSTDLDEYVLKPKSVVIFDLVKRDEVNQR